MKILLVAVNAKYIHSNLAVYSLRTYAGKYADQIKIIEVTINHSEEDILKEIYKEKADVAAFSCYIWNIEIINNISAELRKLNKDIKIWYGGPEVSYDAEKCLTEHQQVDGVMIGEGEQTFLELAQYYIEGDNRLSEINGLAFKDSAKITLTPVRQPLPLDAIPFPYADMETFRNRIIYYESSRGCPFSCSYCLSSIDKRVRLRSAELVKRELKLFLDYNIPQVKFVDRTFNCNKKHSMEIWSFIKENDNGITNFHFEISADLMTEEELEFLSTLRPGQIQFEIGVQSTNPDTIQAIHRKMDLNKLEQNVIRVKQGGNIHQHLDLIAGLPHENFNSFEKSFNEVYRLKPDQFQLGFLKILKGSLMEEESISYGITFRNKPPYEVLFTKDISYDEILTLKGICEMIEIYYNSTQFTYSLSFLEHFYTSPMKLYEDLYHYYESRGFSGMAHNRVKKYEILQNFYRDIVLQDIKDDKPDYIKLFGELLILDLFLREDLKARPDFVPSNPLQNRLRELYRSFQTDHNLIHIEQFTYDIFAAAASGTVAKKEITLMFDYSEKDPLSKAAKLTEITI